MEKIEKEIKLVVVDAEKLINLLKLNGAKLLNKSKERTIRLDTENGDLENKGVFLRVRSGSKNTITMKEKIGDDVEVRARKETEFEIGDVENMAYILKKLGFSKEKIMEMYRVNYEYKGAVLSIDELSFGLFLEIEGTEEQIIEIASELGYKVEDKILVTYWDLFEEFKTKNNLVLDNIEFSVGFESKLMKIIG